MTKGKNGKTIFVCDFGFSSLKWKNGEKHGRFASAFKRVGDKVVVGKEALMDGDSVDVQTIDDLTRLYPYFVDKAASHAGVTGKGHQLAIGLPYGTWKTEMAKNAQGHGSLIDVLTKSLCNSEMFSDVVILPQGLGGISAQVANAEEDLGDILGIDVGFNTVIITLFSKEEQGIIKDHTFFGKGVKDLAINYLMPKIEHHVGQDLNPIQISHIMEKGYIMLGNFNKVDIKKEIAIASKEYCDDLLKYLIGYIKSKWSSAADFDSIVFFGGGARLFKTPPTSSSLKIIVTEEPEFANCRGFAILAEGVNAEGGV